MRNTITEERKNVDTAISAVLKIVESGGGDSRPLHEVEVRLWSLLLALAGVQGQPPATCNFTEQTRGRALREEIQKRRRGRF